MTAISALLCDGCVWLMAFKSRTAAAGLVALTGILSASLASALLVAWGLVRRRAVVVAILASVSLVVVVSLAVLFRLDIIGQRGYRIEQAWLIYWTNLALFVVGRYGRGMLRGEGVASGTSAPVE